jgi:fatty acid-binding protein DegV
MLNIKPLIMVDPVSGLVEALGMAVARRRGIEQMVREFFNHFEPGRPLHVAVMHGDAAQDAAALCERVQAEFQPAELLTNITTPTLGIHTGPRALALIGFSES